MNKPTVEQLAEVCANWWTKELCGEIEDTAIILKFSQYLQSNFKPIIQYNIESGLGLLISIYWQHRSHILDAAEKAGCTNEIKRALNSFSGTSMYANQKQIFTCFEAYFPGKKVIWNQGDPLPVINIVPAYKVDVPAFANAMLMRMNENSHRDQFGSYENWPSDEFYKRAKNNLDEGMAALVSGDFKQAAECFVDVANLALMLHKQSLSGNFVDNNESEMMGTSHLEDSNANA